MEQQEDQRCITAEEYFEKSLDLAKRENVSHEEVILFNVKHLEDAISYNQSVVFELRTALPAFEAQIRPTKLRLRQLASQTTTPSVRKEYSFLAKKLNCLRKMYSIGQQDIVALRGSLKKDRASLKVILDALREYYRQNPCEANSVKG